MVPFMPIDDSVWIFSSTNNEHYNYNSKYFFEYMLKAHTDRKIYFVISDSEMRKKLIKVVGPYFISATSFRGINKILTGRVWITSAGLPIHLIFDRRERLIINLWHGVPLKKIVLLENDITWVKKIYLHIFFSRRYSAVSTTSPRLIPLYAKSFGVEEDTVKVLGQPRNDLLFRDTRNIFEKVFPDVINRKILYAPTYREWGETHLFPFSDFDIDMAEKFLKNIDATIFIRFHLQNQNQEKLVETEHIRFINEDKIEDIMTVLNSFDLLITDYSSIYIDYLILNKPIIFIPYDLDEYSRKRGFNFEYNLVTPGEKVTDTCKHLLKSIQHNLDNPNFYEEERVNANQFFNSVSGSNGARVYQYVLSRLRD